MTDSQLTTIRNYLLAKKLPIDILLEVQDHFVSQISDLEKSENISFEDAFKQTKQSWKRELELYWDGSLDLMDNSKFKKKIEREVWFTILKKTTIYFAFVLLVMVILANLFSDEFFSYFIVSLMISATVFPAVYYFYHFKSFRLIKKYDNYILTLYQVPASIFLSVLGVAVTYIPRTFENTNLLYQFFRFKSGLQNFLFAFAFGFIVFTGIFIFLSQKEYLKRIEKVKPFLPFLKPTS